MIKHTSAYNFNIIMHKRKVYRCEGLQFVPKENGAITLTQLLLIAILMITFNIKKTK